jgi:hypothetical protein
LLKQQTSNSSGFVICCCVSFQTSNLKQLGAILFSTPAATGGIYLTHPPLSLQVSASSNPQPGQDLAALPTMTSMMAACKEDETPRFIFVIGKPWPSIPLPTFMLTLL